MSGAKMAIFALKWLKPSLRLCVLPGARKCKMPIIRQPNMDGILALFLGRDRPTAIDRQMSSTWHSCSPRREREILSSVWYFKGRPRWQPLPFGRAVLLRRGPQTSHLASSFLSACSILGSWLPPMGLTCAGLHTPPSVGVSRLRLKAGQVLARDMPRARWSFFRPPRSAYHLLGGHGWIVQLI